MIAPAPEEVEAELKGAFETLRAAEHMLQIGVSHEAVSSAYYAIFHAARAALWSCGRNAKSHRGLATQFSQEFVTTGVVEPEFAKILQYGREQREIADYDLIRFETDVARANELVQDARRFVDRMKQLIKNERKNT